MDSLVQRGMVPLDEFVRFTVDKVRVATEDFRGCLL